MILGVLEKLSFGVPVWLLQAQGRAQGLVMAFASFDLVLGALFAVGTCGPARPERTLSGQ